MMTETDSAGIDHYLFGEMDAGATEEFETRLLGDDEGYFAVVDRENELVDRYASGSLDADLASRFELSLSGFPARQQKLANAQALKTYIAETTESASVIDERVPWYKRLGFAFKMPAYAAGALGLLLIGAVGFLLVQNRGLQNDVASLQKNAQVDEFLHREAELKSQLEEQQVSTGDLTSDLESERERRAKLEAEIEELRKKASGSVPTGDKPLVPTIATLVLTPTGIRGGPTSARTLTLSETQKRVSIKMFLDAKQEIDGPVRIKVNGVPVASVRPRKAVDGRLSVVFTIPADKLNLGANDITATTAAGDTVAQYTVVRE